MKGKFFTVVKEQTTVSYEMIHYKGKFDHFEKTKINCFVREYLTYYIIRFQIFELISNKCQHEVY